MVEQPRPRSTMMQKEVLHVEPVVAPGAAAPERTSHRLRADVPAVGHDQALRMADGHAGRRHRLPHDPGRHRGCAGDGWWNAASRRSVYASGCLPAVWRDGGGLFSIPRASGFLAGREPGAARGPLLL